MKRHKHSLSHRHITSMDMGLVYPVATVEVCMGDVWRGHSSVLLRASPLVAPVMHPVDIQLAHFYCPYRLLWDGWEDFRTGGSDGEGGSSGAFPTVTAHAVNGFTAKTLPDYMNIPVGSSHPGLEVSALPFRAYAKIWNEYFRDQDLQSELTENMGSGNDATTPLTVQRAAWAKDYFGTARPWAQKGPDITLPLGTEAIVKGASVDHTTSGTNVPARFRRTDNNAAPANNEAGFSGGVGALALNATGFAGAQSSVYPSNLIADLSTATAATVSQLREAMALQRYEEARAQWGSRYVEYLRYYGIRSSDARLQRPEYLGGGHGRMAFTEVLQTSDSGSPAGVGDMYGHGIAAVRSRPFVRFFEEDGVFLTLLVVRPQPMYQTALNRMWSRRIKEDFYTKELELIGQQEVLLKEIYATEPVAGGATWGYQNRYREYCEHPSGVSGDMRSTLDFWHMARQFASAPALNAAFIECDPEKRNFQVTSEDVLWVMVNNNIRARRFVQRNPVARII